MAIVSGAPRVDARGVLVAAALHIAAAAVLGPPFAASKSSGGTTDSHVLKLQLTDVPTKVAADLPARCHLTALHLPVAALARSRRLPLPDYHGRSFPQQVDPYMVTLIESP